LTDIDVKPAGNRTIQTTVTTAAEPRPDEGTGTAADPGRFRQRLLDAFAASIEEDGYAKTTVADIVRHARTSRRTFYEHFSSKEDCFVALHTETNGQIIRQIYAAVDRSASWETQVRHAVEAWIGAAESIPTLMLSWIRDVPALGAGTRRLQRETMEHYIAMVRTLSDTAELRAAGIGPVSRRRAVMLLGGLRELTAITLESGGHIGDITDDAVDASIALLAPQR
jgi:AcrR family transcriptional regulator